jgi:hypothetical protein
MRPSRLMIALAAAVACACCGLTACGKGQPPPPRRQSCKQVSDSVYAPQPQVSIRPPGVAPTAVTTTSAAMSCGTELIVGGDGTAETAFSGTGQARCQVRQLGAPSAKVVTRDPEGALFMMANAHVACSFTGSPRPIYMCGEGTLYPGSGSQATASCGQDPVFSVDVRRGSMEVVDPAGRHHMVTAGSAIAFDFASRKAVPGQAQFSAEDLAALAFQADELGLPEPGNSSPPVSSSPPATPLPQAITVTSPPAQVTAGSTYPATATGGGSGNTVIFAIDPKSTKFCSYSQADQMVTFQNPGMCLIDVSQAGNDQYQAGYQQFVVTIDPQPPA